MAIVETRGVEAANRAVDAVRARIESAIPRAVASMGETLRDKAKEIAPVGTPESTGKPEYITFESYKKSIRARIRGVEKRGNVTYGGVSAGGYVVNPNTGQVVDYAIRNPRSWRPGDIRGIEYGFSRQAPRGVLIPAAMLSSEKMRVNCNRWIIRALRANKGSLTV